MKNRKEGDDSHKIFFDFKMENKDVIDHLKKYWIFLQEIVKFNS